MKVKVLNAPVKKAKEEKQWKCPKCLITFPDHVGLRQHILEFHKIAKLSLTQVSHFDTFSRTFKPFDYRSQKFCPVNDQKLQTSAIFHEAILLGPYLFLLFCLFPFLYNSISLSCWIICTYG